MISKPANARRRREAPRVASLIVLCGIAIIFASCGNAISTVTVRPSSTAAAGQPESPTLRVTPTPAPTGTAPTPSDTAATPAPSDAAPTPAPSGATAFTLLKMATAADSSKPAPDSTTFTQTYPTTAPAIYVVFALSPGLTGKITCAISANGVQLMQPLTIDYGSKNSWGDFKVRSRGRFVKGDYRATLTYVPTGEAASISFTVR